MEDDQAAASLALVGELFRCRHDEWGLVESRGEVFEGDRLGRHRHQGEKGELLAGSVIRRAWRSARVKVLTPDEFASPLGRRVYDLRHTRLTKWLNDGIPPAQVAEWAGNSVPILLAIYARCVFGQLSELKKRMEAGEDLPELPDVG
ncbi:hypothetical protein [Streptomyces sp. NBC_01438]|uniref:hypothetical protein n=1 Tax=Streptomyces sp. NBC_01438 TaxID=2903866 RepID=UPI0032555410